MRCFISKNNLSHKRPVFLDNPCSIPVNQTQMMISNLAPYDQISVNLLQQLCGDSYLWTGSKSNLLEPHQ